MVYRYGTKLLMRYARHVDDDAALTVPEHSVDVVHCIHLKLVAHLSGIGDLPSSPSRWASAPNVKHTVEGFTIEPCEHIRDDDISYRCYVSKGQWTSWCQLGAYCGAKGASLAIFRLELRLSAAAARRL